MLRRRDCAFLAARSLKMKVLYAPEGDTGLRKAEAIVDLTEAGSQEEKLSKARMLGENLAGEVKRGKVWLLGAGPGDMGLLTRKALWCIRHADVLVYDNLASGAILNEAREDAELIYAGKRADKHHLRQWETNALLVEKALAGKNVARVKGGDPFIFGRGGEEAPGALKGGRGIRNHSGRILLLRGSGLRGYSGDPPGFCVLLPCDYGT